MAVAPKIAPSLSTVHSFQQGQVGGKEPKSVRALPAQDNHLMSQRDKPELQ
jgi:hypothetical protein